MDSQKTDSRLSLALSLEPGSPELNDFLYNMDAGAWELIIKYNPILEPFSSPYLVSFTPLICGFAIIQIMPRGIPELLNSPSIEYAELPKEMFYQLNNAVQASCIKKVPFSYINFPNTDDADTTDSTGTADVADSTGIERQIFARPQQQNDISYFSTNVETGRGVLIAVIDSGIDYRHPDFRNPDGTTRILSLWDQTLHTNESSGKYSLGQIFSEDEINQALIENSPALVPSYDVSGHGTHVAGICAGNGRASMGLYMGVAPEAGLLIIKLGSFANSRTALTSHLMMALDYCVNESLKRNMPLAVNLSYGENFGPHDGMGLLDRYIGEIALIGKTCICIGTGNEGASGRHASAVMGNNETRNIELNLSSYESSLTIQAWKNYYDDISVELTTSEGFTTGILFIPQNSRMVSFELGSVSLFIYFGLPTPFNIRQEIFFYAVPRNTADTVSNSGRTSGSFTESTDNLFTPTGFLPEGIWTISLYSRNVRTGSVDIWLPSARAQDRATRFIIPNENTTLTVPSTAPAAISVGGYDSNTLSYASFSGRGFTSGPVFIKPELCAPAVNIISAAPEGGYTSRSGTSMAVPFVTGSLARLMEWGIIKGNDPYLYGERAKAFLINGTKTLPAYTQYPNPSLGYGILCLKDSYPL